MDLSLDDTHEALRVSIATCCERSSASPGLGTFDRSLWKSIAEVGLFDLGVPGDGTAVHLAVACIELGRQRVYGPLAATMLARHCGLGEISADVAEGRLVASVATTDGTVPWGPLADVLLSIDDDVVWVCELDGGAEPVTSISGEAWSRAQVRRVQPCGEQPAALALAHLCAGAWAVGCAQGAVDDAAAYARDRVQFGRSIGEFQAIAHPLAESAAALLACRTGILTAAWRLDVSGATVPAAAARLAGTRAALDAVLVVHQTYGALGFIEDGPLGMIAMRLRELRTLAPGDAHARRILAADLLGPPEVSPAP